MAEIGELKPLHPIWPPRPRARSESRKRRPQEPKVKDAVPDRDDDEEDGRQHIDEYA